MEERRPREVGTVKGHNWQHDTTCYGQHNHQQPKGPWEGGSTTGEEKSHKSARLRSRFPTNQKITLKKLKGLKAWKIVWIWYQSHPLVSSARPWAYQKERVRNFLGIFFSCFGNFIFFWSWARFPHFFLVFHDFSLVFHWFSFMFPHVFLVFQYFSLVFHNFPHFVIVFHYFFLCFSSFSSLFHRFPLLFPCFPWLFLRFSLVFLHVSSLFHRFLLLFLSCS